MPGRSRRSRSFSVARAGNVFSDIPKPRRKSTAAIGLIQSSSAPSSRSAIASTRTLTRWSELQFAAIHFFELQLDAHVRQIGNLGDRRAGPGAVAFLERRRRGTEGALRAEVRKDIDDAVLRSASEPSWRDSPWRDPRRERSCPCAAARRSRSASCVVLCALTTVLTCFSSPSEMPTSMRLFAPSISETTSALLASSLARSRLYSAVIRFMPSCSSTMRCDALVWTISLSTVRTVVLRSSRCCSCCAASNSTTTSPFLIGRAGFGDPYDARIGNLRRGQDHGIDAADLAARLHRNDELGPAHLGNGNFDCGRFSAVTIGRNRRRRPQSPGIPPRQ